uniref:Mesothelin n=1 Tax=Latimeria chalumnae TaxID=7897 RepID=H2ZWE6_LATCH
RLSPSILQGFSCKAVNSLNISESTKLIKTFKGKDIDLKVTQLSCMAKLAAPTGIPAESELVSYPPDVLLAMDTSKLNSSNCRSFFKIAGKGAFKVFGENSAKSMKLLKDAIKCLGITNSISKGDLAILNNLVCGLNGNIIENSDPSIVDLLKTCKLTSDQKSSVIKLLKSGNTTFGDTSEWTVITLKSLGILPLYFGNDIWSNIKQDTTIAFLKYVLENLEADGITMETKATFLSNFLPSNSTLATGHECFSTGCTVGKITRSTILKSEFPVHYDFNQFDLCLDNDVLLANLAALANKPLPESYLQIIKTKLDQEYPSGTVPEDHLKLLRSIARNYSVFEIRNWNITSVDTLASLMNSKDLKWEDSPASTIITKYLKFGGKLDAVTLKTIGGQYLCTLNESQINTITSASVRDTGVLVISTCLQSKKNKIYLLSKNAFEDKSNDTTVYYNLIRTYLSGAPVSDLKALAVKNINMDIETFMSLNPTEILKLTVHDVKGMLGRNLVDLKEHETDSTVSEWINSQSQSALDTLGI